MLIFLKKAIQIPIQPPWRQIRRIQTAGMSNKKQVLYQKLDPQKYNCKEY
jgi:hypothetical protein